MWTIGYLAQFTCYVRHFPLWNGHSLQKTNCKKQEIQRQSICRWESTLAESENTTIWKIRLKTLETTDEQCSFISLRFGKRVPSRSAFHIVTILIIYVC